MVMIVDRIYSQRNLAELPVTRHIVLTCYPGHWIGEASTNAGVLISFQGLLL